MVFFCFARKACDKGCPENDIRDLSAQLGNDSYKLCFGSAAAHSLKNAVRCVLDRNIQIMTDLFLITNGFDQFIVNLLRIAVKNTDPADTSDLTELL